MSREIGLDVEMLGLSRRKKYQEVKSNNFGNTSGLRIQKYLVTLIKNVIYHCIPLSLSQQNILLPLRTFRLNKTFKFQPSSLNRKGVM